MNINEILAKEISTHFKPVEYLRFEEDYTKEPEYVGEYSKKSLPPIMGGGESSHEKRRLPIMVMIGFNDHTGFKYLLKPEDYLGKMQSNTYDFDEGFGAHSAVHKNERKYDYNKILDTLLKKLHGKKIENPTLETVDYMRA